MRLFHREGKKIGNRVRVKVVKNKVAPPFQEAEFDIMFGKGISREGDVLDLAVKYDIVLKSGAWYSYKGDRISQGRKMQKNIWQNIRMCLMRSNRVSV